MCTVDKTLAEIALAVNNGPCELHPMPGGGTEGKKRFLLDEMDHALGEEGLALRGGMYMLLALTLELWRRNEYVFAALSANLDAHAFEAVDPTYAARISLHNQGLHSFEKPDIGGTDWKARAEMANDIVHRMLLVTEAPHQQFLSAAAAGVSRPDILEEEIHDVPGLQRLNGSMDEPHIEEPTHDMDDPHESAPQNLMAAQASVAQPAEFSELLRAALKIGWTLVPYDPYAIAHPGG